MRFQELSNPTEQLPYALEWGRDEEDGTHTRYHDKVMSYKTGRP